MTRSSGYLMVVLMAGATGSTMPTAVGAQTPAFAATTSLDSATEAAVMREIAAARGRGLPAEPLMAKVREGRLKRASGIRIRGAVAALAVRLDSARAALGPDAVVTELVAAADVLAAGGSVGALRTVREATAMRPLSAPLGALAQLVASGVPVPKAVSMIVDLLHRNVAPAQVLAFGNAVESDAASGLPAEQAALFRLHSIRPAGDAGLTPSSGVSDPIAANAGKPPISPPPTTVPRRRP
jgi:hypothetical protein